VRLAAPCLPRAVEDGLRQARHPHTRQEPPQPAA
jgi:hypothetical protein